MPRIWSVVLLLSLLAPCAAAQQAATPSPLKAKNALNGPPSATSEAGTQTVTLGTSTVPLTGPWKFHTGDNMAWAQPDYDDSAWGTMDLTPPPGSYDPIIGSSGFVPGWTTRGYKGYSGYAWYRLRVNIQSHQTALALKMPDNFDDAYQVYVNGQLIGQYGKFAAHGVTAYLALPRTFPLPTNVHSGPATIAIRMWMSAYTALVDPDVGGLHGPPVLGQASAIDGLLNLDWYAVNRSMYGDLLELAILLLALLVAFGLFWLDMSEPTYLWLGLVCVATLAVIGSVVAGNYAAWITGNFLFFFEDAVLTPLAIGLWVVFWATWFRLGGMARLHRIVWGLVVLLGIGVAMLRWPLYGAVVPVHASVWLSPLNVALKLLLGVVLVWVTVRGIRRDKVGGWLVLPAVALVIVAQYQEELSVLHVPVNYFPFGVSITIRTVAIVLSLIIITVLLLRRFLYGQRERVQMKLEMEQARNMQQVLIPSTEALPTVAGYTIESEYRPARQVGGDFFQIIREKDGSVLIVVGDVSGKGLKAAMLVSLIVGAIRMAADMTQDPMAILEALNRRLCGRMQGHFATCVVVRIAANGETVIANAGHLPPYRNGQEVAIEGSLPLGIVDTAEFEQASLTLEPGDRMTLLTDGVVEAMNAQREMFGFDRTRAASDGTAVSIVSAALAFGQQDDITVIRIEREAAPVPESPLVPVPAA